MKTDKGGKAKETGVGLTLSQFVGRSDVQEFAVSHPTDIARPR